MSSKQIVTLSSVVGALLLTQLVSCSKFQPTNPVPYDGPGEELPADQLPTPTDLQILDVGDTYLQLAWTDTTGQAPAILVEGRLAHETDYSLWTILPAGTSEWDARVLPDSSYVIRIAARNTDGHSPWTEPVSATALAQGYWEVSGGVRNDTPGCRDLFFRFGRANRFRPTGTLTIAGPEGWNDGREFQKTWGSYYIGLSSIGVTTGRYNLKFATVDRLFEAAVDINASLVLSLPEVQFEILPGRRVQAEWSCVGAETFGFCWGPWGRAPCVSAGTSTDTLLVAREDDPVYMLKVTAFANDLDGQPASSSRTFTIDFGE